MKWKADFRFLDATFAILFEKQDGLNYYCLLSAAWVVNWFKQFATTKFEILFNGYMSIWSILFINKDSMVQMAVMTDPHTPGGAIVLNHAQIDEVKNVCHNMMMDPTIGVTFDSKMWFRCIFVTKVARITSFSFTKAWTTLILLRWFWRRLFKVMKMWISVLSIILLKLLENTLLILRIWTKGS